MRPALPSLTSSLGRWEHALMAGDEDTYSGQVASRWTRVRGRRVHVRVSTHPVPPGAPTVVLVHGLVVSSRYMVPTLLRLARTCRVLAPDLPGFGRSDKPPRPPENMSDIADALADWMEAAGLERALFLGNSLGCQTLADFAARYPERTEGLVLQGPTMDAEARSVREQLWRWLVNSMRERSAQLPLLVHDYWEAGLPRFLDSFRMALRDRIEDKLPQVEAPTLVVRGSRDPIVSQRWAEQVTGLLPRGRLAVIPGGTHTLNFAAPLELVRVLQPFLRELRAGAERTPHA
jgi:2-hydroxy-6-oxonona-2,4-dienedioate hydrolase